MPDIITDYLLTLYEATTLQLEAFPKDDYYAFQVYVNNAFLVEMESPTFRFAANVNDKIDILGVSVLESGTDFSSTLDDSNGDKVSITVPSDYSGTIDFYSDAGSGIINYGDRLGRITVASSGGAGWGHFPWGFNGWGGPAASLRIFVTKRQKNAATIQYSVVPINGTAPGDPYIFTETIHTRPDQIKPEIRNYDSSTGTLTIEAM